MRAALLAAAARPKVVDLCTAQRVHRERSHTSGALPGSRFYTAPETARDQRLHQARFFTLLALFCILLIHSARGCEAQRLHHAHHSV